eukprot:403337531
MSGSSNSYSNFISQNLSTSNMTTSPQIYDFIDNSKDLTYVQNQTQVGWYLNFETNTFNIRQPITYFYSGMTDAMTFQDLVLYLISSQTALVIRDTKRNWTNPNQIKIGTNKLKFSVSVKNYTSYNSIFDLVVCSNGAVTQDSCLIYDLYANNQALTTNVTLRNNITLKAQCADKLILTQNYLVVACSPYSSNSGKLSVYSRNSNNNTLTLLIQEVGNTTAQNNYQRLGDSMTITEHNLNHTTLYYTSTLVNNSITYSYINTIQLMRFDNQTGVHHRYHIQINQYRVKSNDSFNKGLIQMTNLPDQMLLSYSNLQTIYQFPLCGNKFTLYDNYCVPCNSNEFTSNLNSQICESCSNTDYATSSYQGLIKYLYCTLDNPQSIQSFNTSLYTFQSTRIVLPHSLGTNNTSDNSPLNTAFDDFTPINQNTTDDNQTSQNNTNNNQTNTNQTNNQNNNTNNQNNNTSEQIKSKIILCVIKKNKKKNGNAGAQKKENVDRSKKYLEKDVPPQSEAIDIDDIIVNKKVEKKDLQVFEKQAGPFEKDSSFQKRKKESLQRVKFEIDIRPQRSSDEDGDNERLPTGKIEKTDHIDQGPNQPLNKQESPQQLNMRLQNNKNQIKDQQEEEEKKEEVKDENSSLKYNSNLYPKIDPISPTQESKNKQQLINANKREVDLQQYEEDESSSSISFENQDLVESERSLNNQQDNNQARNMVVNLDEGRQNNQINYSYNSN